ncbi:hypothetical protein SBA1_120018 [Candidatus Sulfotelmatobacter kueseliae]|uniref:Uncharacterized protein n=1 Tax=Candidatus Sulfotelmatobacter kueseliae TaxID=2042962 RepID=A0A2U3K1T3_9BACT|nr:hypothetical protein SBA1_120018 [Candidatus Sulfotelmatobacter kueseliae]
MRDRSRVLSQVMQVLSNVSICGHSYVGTAAPGCPVERSSTAQSVRAKTSPGLQQTAGELDLRPRVERTRPHASH